MNFWVCFERSHEETPWVVRRYRQTTQDTRRKGFWKLADAQLRVDRLKTMWLRWYASNVRRRIPPEGLTEEAMVTLASKVFDEMCVEYYLGDIRRQARKVGINPDDVIRYEVTPGEPRKVFPGPLLNRVNLDLLEASRKPLTVEVGQSWATLDPRRTTIMKIAKIEKKHVVDASGRRLMISRLLTRYRLM